MAFRDDRDALLARADALQTDLDRAESELEASEDARERLRDERDAMAKELAALRKRLGDPEPASEPARDGNRNAQYAVLGVALGALVAMGGIGWVVYRVLAPSPRPAAATTEAGRPVGMCPLRGDGTITIIDQTTSRNRRKYFYSLSTYEVATGKRRLRVPLEGNESHTPSCHGYEGELVWIRRSEKLGFRARRIATGELVHRQADLASRSQVAIHRVEFDKNGNHLLVSTADGRRYHAKASDGLALVPVPSGHRVARSSGTHWPSNPSLWARLDDSRRLRPEGDTRRRFLIGKTPIGSRDWLRPKLVLSPRTNTALWPSPDSLLIVEPTLLRSPKFTITRYGLDGRVLWTFRPQEPSYTTNWANYIAVGDALLYPTKTGYLIAVDPKTGTQRYRVRL